MSQNEKLAKLRETHRHSKERLVQGAVAVGVLVGLKFNLVEELLICDFGRS